LDYLLGGQLDEFPDQAHAFAQAGRAHQFGDNPVLNLVESTQEDIQVGSDLWVGMGKSIYVSHNVPAKSLAQ